MDDDKELKDNNFMLGVSLLGIAVGLVVIFIDPLHMDPYAPYNVERFIRLEEEDARLLAEEKACVARTDGVHITMHLKGSTYMNPRWICMPLELYNVHKRKDK